MIDQPLALALDSSILLAIGAVGVVVLGVIWFAVRFWLASTRPANIKDIPTPSLDRLNREALAHMAGETAQQDEAETRALADEEAPEELKKVVPEDQESKDENQAND